MTEERTPKECIETLRNEYRKARDSGFSRAMTVTNLSQRFGIAPWKIRAFCNDNERSVHS